MENHENCTREELIDEINALYKVIENQKKFSVLFDSSPEAILYTTGDGRFLECNTSASILFGYNKDEMTDLSFEDIATEDIADKLPSIFREELSNDGIIHTGTYKKKSGEIFPAELLTKLIKINGQTYRWAIFHDLSEYDTDGSENVINDEKIKDLIRLLPELIGEPEIIIETDKFGTIISVNKIFFEKTGYSEKDIEKGLEIGILIQTDINENPRIIFKKFLKGESPEVTEYSVVKKDGTKFPVIIYTTKIDLKSKSHGLRLFATDITEHKYFEKNLINMEKFHALGEISGGVLHNINNVLAIILGYIEISSRKKYKYKQCEVCLNILDKIKIAALEGSETVKRINNISKIKQHVINEPVEINSLIEETLEFCSPKLENIASENGIKISVIKDLHPIPDIIGNSTEIREVLNNIIINSIEAMPSGGEISVTTNMENETVVIQITDTGLGMTDETKSNIFKPFYTTKEKNGTGLGLYVSKEMIKKFGGDIIVESKLSKGTSITIFLPASKEKRVQKKKNLETGSVKKTKGIIVIDDEESICEILCDFLSIEGHSVTAVRDGKQAFKIFDPKLHEIVITDLNMPVLTGLDIAKRLKRKSPKTTLILITGSIAANMEILKKENIVDYILPKPINFRELLKIIDLVPVIETE
ncbi:PAS domain S-box protein [Candidatus Latescibacterota bacterium]